MHDVSVADDLAEARGNDRGSRPILASRLFASRFSTYKYDAMVMRQSVGCVYKSAVNMVIMSSSVHILPSPPALHAMLSPLILALALLSFRASGAPAGISSLSPFPETTATHATATPTVSLASDATNAPLWGPDTTGVLPEAVRGRLGAKLLGPHNVPIELENPDLLAPPTTDEGSMYVFPPGLCVLCPDYVLRPEREVVRRRRAVGRVCLAEAGHRPFALSNNRLQTGGWARQQNGT
jgi:hypothetical protein